MNTQDEMTEGTEVVSSRGVVAANPPEAARVGTRVLAAGGNAMDAAAAASMACCMLQPMSTGVGGYVCCAVVLEGKSGKTWSVDANAIAPAAAHERMFELLPMKAGSRDINESEFLCTVKDNANIHGPLAVAPPGMMAGMGIIWERWGRLKWEQIVAPSQALLADGFPYASVAGAIAGHLDTLHRFPATERHLMPDGKLPRADDTWHRPDMEKTLARIAATGWRDFYDGEVGRAIADHILAAGGIMTREDMAAYQPRVTDPYTVNYRGARVHGPILTNGCISVLQVLNMLATLSLPEQDTPPYWHVYAEVLKLAWRDRLRYLADPDFIDVPVARLLSADYAWGLTEPIRQFPERVDTRTPPESPNPPHGTLHVSTADAEGNVVSMTISQGGWFGSCETVPGTGIILGHGMARLDPRPGRANSIEPRKRPLNNTACVIAQLPDRDVALGLPGGRRIIGVMPRAVQLLADRGLTSRQVATAPRMHIEAREPLELREGEGHDTADALRAMGHTVTLKRSIAGCINGAEVLKPTGGLRAGSGVSAAGV